MRCASLSLASAFLAHHVTAADLSQGEVGGWHVANIPSPNGVYRLTTRPYDDQARFTTLVLQHGARQRVLAKFVRTGDVIWSPDSRFLIFIDKHSPLEHTIKIFHIGHRVTEMKWIDRVILQALEFRIPRYSNRELHVQVRSTSSPIRYFSWRTRLISFRLGRRNGPVQGVTTLFKVDLNALTVASSPTKPAI